MKPQNKTHTQTQFQTPKKPTLREYLNTTDDLDFALTISILFIEVNKRYRHLNPLLNALSNVDDIVNLLQSEYNEDMFYD